jgi:hypothetical protein
MSNFEYLQYLIEKYRSILNLCNLAGVKSKETEWKLESCFYMLGQVATRGKK